MTPILCSVAVTMMLFSSAASLRNNTLPSPPAHIVQFELSDAAVPNKDTEETIRQGRARSQQQKQQQPPSPPPSTTRSPVARQPPPPNSRSGRQTTSSTTTQQPRQQQQHRRGRAPMPAQSLPSAGDMATEESRVVQIRLPLSAMPPKHGRQVDSGGNKGPKHFHEFPVEVRNVIGYVLKKSPLKMESNGLNKTPLTVNQRYAKNSYGEQQQQHHQQQQPQQHHQQQQPLQQWWYPHQLTKPQTKGPIVTYAAQQYVPDMSYNTIQASVQHERLPVSVPVEDNTNYASEAPQNVEQPFQILIPSNSPDDPSEQPEAQHQPLHVPTYNDNWFIVRDAEEQQHQQRPQDSTAPVLFPLGARLPLPKSNFSAAVVNKYQTLASIATPVISSDFYHLPGEPKTLAVADNAQQYYNELDADASIGSRRPLDEQPLITAQQFYPSAMFYSPKDHTPIIEPAVEEESPNAAALTKLETPGKSPYGFVPQPFVKVVPQPLPVYAPHAPPQRHQFVVPLLAKAPQPTSYSKFRGSIDSQPLNLHQYAAGYTFGYRVRDAHTGNDFGHTQNRDTDGVTHGEYHILLPDGRIQSVKYMADEQGFHADVRYNGAGGGSSDAASDRSGSSSSSSSSSSPHGGTGAGLGTAAAVSS